MYIVSCIKPPQCKRNNNMDNLFASAPGQSNLFAAPIFQNESTAVLYVFSPRRMSDHYKRPIVYNFNASFIEELYGTITDSLKHNPVNGQLPGNSFNPNLDRLYRNPYAAGIIMPAYTGGIQMNTSALSDNWTFMLLVDNDQPDKTTALFTRNATSRTIYSGICLDEPVNPVNHGHELTPNGGCFFTVTHATAINKLPTIGARSIGSNRYDTVADLDVIPGQTMSMLTPTPLIMNRPDDIRRMTITDPEDGRPIVAIADSDVIGNTVKHQATSANLNSPRKHGRKILDSIISGYESLDDDNYSGSFSQFPSAIDGNDNVTVMIDAHMRDNTNEHFLGLQIDRPVALAEILRKYNPKMVPVYINENKTFSPIPQQYQCPTNVYSSMIAAAAPSVISNVGLASLACMYNSYHNAFQVTAASSFVTMNQQELDARVSTAYRLLRSELFDIIAATAGPFDVNMSVACNGDTHIVFNLLDVGTENTDIYENHNLLGGMTNQLVGTSDIIQNNSIALGHMLGALNSTI